MRSVDTNIIVRFLVGDGGEQAETAHRLLAAGNIVVAATVILETGWVLRSSYHYPPDRVVHALRHLARLPGIAVEHPLRVATALDWFEAGLDFADALHLAGASGCTAFVSFDRTLARDAARLSAIPVVAP